MSARDSFGDMTRPTKTNVQPDEAATIGYFDSQSERWTQRYSRDGCFRARLETVLEWLKDEPAGLRLLDYGCGSGVLLAALARAGHFVTGVDVSAGMLASSRRTLVAAAVPVDRFDLEQLSSDAPGVYLNRTYDGIICLGVIEYLERPMELLRSLADLLRPRGVLIVSFPNRSSVLRTLERFVFRNPFVFRCLGLFPHLTGSDSYLKFQKHQFTVAEIEQCLAQKGLRRQRVHCHVAPGVLQGWSTHPALGMTVIAEFRRNGP